MERLIIILCIIVLVSVMMVKNICLIIINDGLNHICKFCKIILVSTGRSLFLFGMFRLLVSS